MTEQILTPRAILFDLDGTLIDSSRDIVACWTRVIVAADLRLDDVAELHGVPARQSLARLLGPERADELDHWADFLLDAECSETSNTEALPGAHELLEQLTRAGLTWGIVTSCQAPLAAARMSAAGIAKPALLVTADDVVKGKPDPEPFLLGARLAGVSPSDTLVVEDAVAGIKAGLAAGATVAAVGTTHSLAELAIAHHVLPDLPALARLLRPALPN